MKIILCTGNRGKLLEVSRILDMPLDSASPDLDEIQGLDALLVCRRKAAEAFALLGRPVLVDDTALHLAALGGFPGALVTWAIESGGPELLHRMLPPGASPAASAVTVIGYADEAGVETFAGALAGHVVAAPRGAEGFGFDPVFVPEGEERTLAEMSAAEKDSLSPRGRALRQAAAFLRARAGA
ncbi:MAG TPA: non-canonical purine NTP pyrophosphatase [Allosphingosinicella sp.]|nr:non-canonical purine NTP pyrophosphatase [Allosphingosinicella sp.]